MTRWRGRTRCHDAGSATIWVLVCCLLLASIAGFAVVRASAVVARHRAESSADLAALAAAGQIGISNDECAAARRIAARNRARLTACRVELAADQRSGSVTVAVRVDVHLAWVGARQIVATARAGRLPPITAARAAPDRGG